MREQAPKSEYIGPDVEVDNVDVENAELRQRLKKLAWLMDRSVPLPGGLRIGLDGLLGLIPGVGDAVGGTISTWIIFQARRAGAPTSLIVRMLFNMFVDFLVGLVPFAGDLFDFAFKANVRNVRLLEQYLDQPQKVQRRSRWKAAVMGIASVGMLVAAIYIIYFLLRLVISSLQ